MSQRFLYTSAISIVLGLLILGGLNFLGFCFKELRFISDEEKIKLAVTAAIADFPRFERQYNYALKTDDVLVKPEHFNNAEDFIKANPNCCILNSSGFSGATDNSSSTWDRITGSYNYSVKVEFKYDYIKTSNLEHTETLRKQATGVFWLAAGNCGTICCED